MNPQFWPLFLVVAANIGYHLAAKNMPQNIPPFFNLTIVYILSAVLSAMFQIFIHPDESLTSLFSKLNWTTVALAASLVGLEVGYLLMYRTGWRISIGALTANTLLAIALLIIGVIFYKEDISMREALGMSLCLAGLLLVNL